MSSGSETDDTMLLEEVQVVIDDDDEEFHTEEESLMDSQASGVSKVKGSFKYPRHALSEELSCIPDMPGSFPRVGQLYVCCTGEERTEEGGLREDQIIWTVGPCWPMLFCTYILIIGISMFVYASFGSSLPFIFWIAGVSLTAVVTAALTKTACSNPGILPRVAEAPDQTWRWSDPAQSYYPPNATYCRESQVIVRDYDHFCPWTGTTIAGGNIGWFGCFVSSLGVLCVFVMFVAIGGSAVATAQYGK